MIDLHNHILPGVDDGAADLDESVEIARQFAAEGVTQIAATPHFDALRGSGPSRDDVLELVAMVQQAIDGAGIPLRVSPGQELYLTPDAESLLQDGAVSTIAGGKYVLVEVSLTNIERPLYLDDSLFRLQLAGFTPILAHPERYPFVQRDLNSLDSVLSRGVPLQVTAPSLLGEYGGAVKRTAEALVRRGAYSLGGSDRHHPGPARSLRDLHACLTRLAGEETADLFLRDNPERVLSGRELVLADAPDEPTPSFWRRLLRS